MRWELVIKIIDNFSEDTFYLNTPPRKEGRYYSRLQSSFNAYVEGLM